MRNRRKMIRKMNHYAKTRVSLYTANVNTLMSEWVGARRWHYAYVEPVAALTPCLRQDRTINDYITDCGMLLQL